MMHNKKSQVAMEFLMTYGWAILIVLIVLAALFFLGVFNPRIANACLATVPFVCSDVKLTDGGAGSDTLTLVLGATGSYSNPPTVSSGTVNGQTATVSGSSVISTTTPSPITLTSAATTSSLGGRFSGTATIIYTQTGGTSHTTTITFSGTAE